MSENRGHFVLHQILFWDLVSVRRSAGMWLMPEPCVCACVAGRACVCVCVSENGAFLRVMTLPCHKEDMCCTLLHQTGGSTVMESVSVLVYLSV